MHARTHACKLGPPAHAGEAETPLRRAALRGRRRRRSRRRHRAEQRDVVQRVAERRDHQVSAVPLEFCSSRFSNQRLWPQKWSISTGSPMLMVWPSQVAIWILK
mmetsp:Transcript_35448/g.110553  ORF Transcript_35448/g.110553 Transcript_35448/m.110553 type:complete len:104 (-) Transcript_35448:641-952(-)